LRDVNVVLREKERELAILKKQVEALKVAAALLEEEYWPKQQPKPEQKQSPPK
jgi:hypothetical protein